MASADGISFNLPQHYWKAIPPTAIAVAVGELFLILAALQILPQGVNVISQLAAGKIAGIGIAIASPLFISILPCFYKFIKDKHPAIRVISTDEAKQELEDGVVISEDVIANIQTSMPVILAKSILDDEEKPGITFHKCSMSHRVFELDAAPGLIFKMRVLPKQSFFEASTQERYDSMIRAKKICMKYQLGLIIIPHAQLFTINIDGKSYEIIAEEKLEFDHNLENQRTKFINDDKSLDEAIRQAARVISKTGFSDVDYRNIPILDNNLDENGNQKIAFIDLEEMDMPAIGLFGGNISGDPRLGLINCVSERQRQIVQDIADEYEVAPQVAGVTPAFPKSLEW